MQDLLPQEQATCLEELLEQFRPLHDGEVSCPTEALEDGEAERSGVALQLNRRCTLPADVRELALMAATLANGGVHPQTGNRAIRGEHVRDVLTLMFTCGMYDTSGSWAYSVGLPAKSGVGGGILAVVPGRMGLAVYSPRHATPRPAWPQRPRGGAAARLVVRTRPGRIRRIGRGIAAGGRGCTARPGRG